MSEEIEVIEETESEGPTGLSGSLRRVLMAGIGAFVLAQEEIEEFVRRLVDRGEIADKEGRQLLQDISQYRKKLADEARERSKQGLEQRVERLLESMNVPTKADIDALTAQIEDLGRKVEALKRRR